MGIWVLAIEEARSLMAEAETVEDLDLRKKVVGWSKIWQSRQGIQRVIEIAKHLPPVSVAGGWDPNPYLLAVKNGVVDLRSGELRQGIPEDLLTLSARVDFDAAVTCSRWDRFLVEIFDGNTELVDYVQRCVGYALTGDTSEQVWWLLHGSGANGKTTLLRVLSAVLGSYARTVPFSLVTLPERQIPDDLADLPCKRLVFASEAIEGARLNEARIKALTGGDLIAARRLYGRWFTFEPHLKLLLCCNHRPAVRDASVGFWRRVQVIPFTQSFHGADKDKDLDATLMAELPGILTWAVRGCIAWQGEGLNPPPVVVAASEEYRQESDQLAQFVEERCEEAPDASCRASDLYSAYTAWANNHRIIREDQLTITAFGRQVSMRFPKEHTRDGNIYRGIRHRATNGAA